MTERLAMKRTAYFRKGTRWILLLVLTACVWALAAAPGYAAERDVEWGCYQNSTENNGVIGDIPTPESYQQTALLWGKKMLDGYTVSFTPPLIIDGNLYTASNKFVYVIDKQSGEVLRQSEELKLNVGYAMNPITYDEENDQLYVPIMRGRVECLDAETLEEKWISKEYQYSQSLSPISCRDGLVYTGIWETEKDDGAFLCLDAESGEEVWTYVPSESGASAGERPHGFYWAGAYVTEDYVIVGSDDGVENTFSEAEAGAYPESAIVYCFDRRTGEVIDRITGIKGDIRSTIVHHDGNIYFVSKGGRLYKAALGADGSFGQESFIQLTAERTVADGSGGAVTTQVDAMMTSTPVVHNGRIYAGAAGGDGQFNADGKHFFAVIRDDGTLSQDSLIYTVKIPGYPQAAPLLQSQAGSTDGKVRLYFTFNAFPGGIYYLDDSQRATAADHENAHLLYRPEKEMQQYCISPLCCDREGTFYYKNDSGYLMAVGRNEAWLDDIEVTYEDVPLQWESPFESGILNYTLQAPGGADHADIRLSVPEGMSATVDGKPYSSGKVSVPIGEDASAIPVVVTKTVAGKSWSRTYTLNTSSLSNNANLAGFAITDTNTKPQMVDTADKKVNDVGIGYDPAFDAGITEYVSRTYGDSKRFVNIWPQTADPLAQIRVLPSANVGNSGSTQLEEDGSLRVMTNGRTPVYWVQGEQSAEVDVEVTSPSGKVVKLYHVTLVRSNEHLDVGATPLVVSPASMTLYSAGPGRGGSIRASFNKENVTERCTFESTDPAVVTVDSAGNVSAFGEGDAEIWVTYEDGVRRTRTHVDVETPTLEKPVASVLPGSYTEPLQIQLQQKADGGQIRYTIGGAEEDLAAPTTTTGEVYEGPIRIDGTEGEVTSVKIRAIACGDGYHRSAVANYTYTVDLREGSGPSPQEDGVSLAPDSVTIAGLETVRPAFARLPAGTSREDLAGRLADVKAQVTMNDENGTQIETDIVWEDPALFFYDPEDMRAQTFFAQGQAVLPEGVGPRGNSLQVFLPVTVAGKTMAKVQFSPASGTYHSDQSVVLTCSEPGASVYYTITGEEDTLAYKAPILLSTDDGTRENWTIKAYAVKNGVESELVSARFIIQKPGAPTGLTAAVNAAKKKITVKWKAPEGASKYQVSWRKAGAATWTSKTVTKAVYTISGLKAGGLYEVKCATLTEDGRALETASRYCLIAQTTLKLKAAKKSFKATVKKAKGATGTQIRYSLKKNLAGAKVKKTKGKTLTVKKLKAKKVYYVEAAPYKVYGGKTWTGQPLQKKVKVK